MLGSNILAHCRRHAPPGENAGQEIASSMNLRDGERPRLAVQRRAGPATGALARNRSTPRNARAAGKRIVHAGW